MVFCSSCGKGNPEGAKFCNGCGFPIEDTAVNEHVSAAKSPAQTYSSPIHPQQIAYPQWPAHGPSQPDPQAQQSIESQNAPGSNAAVIRCTRCGTMSAVDARFCEECSAPLSPDFQQNFYPAAPTDTSTIDAPMWAKILAPIWILAMLGSGLILLIDGIAYGYGGGGILGLTDILIFGAIFLVTFGLYRFIGRLPRSVRKSIKRNLKDFKFSENPTSPNVQNPQNLLPQTAIGFQYCSACGTALEQGAIFCSSCGSANR